MISHHPSPATLQAYALATLPEALSLVTATHIGLCQACHLIVAAEESKAGLALANADPLPLHDDALEAMLARLDLVEQSVAPPPTLNPHLPPPLDRVSFGGFWRTGMGFRWSVMQCGGTAWGGLLFMRPGGILPWHGHAGQEFTCVLSGAFADRNRIFRVGDLAEETQDHPGALRVVGTEPCLCIVASEGLRLPGWLGRFHRRLSRYGKTPGGNVTLPR